MNVRFKLQRPAAMRILHPMRSCSVLLSFAVFTARAQAAALLDNCRPTDSAFLCRLRSILTLLYTAAGLLGVLLLFAILAAVRAYRRKARKLSPEDITPDAE